MTARPVNKLKPIANLFALIGGVILVAGVVYLFLTPKVYQAVTRLKIAEWIRSKDLHKITDLGAVADECDLIRSDAMLNQTITNLGLVEIWGKRYHPEFAANPNETRERLKSKLQVHPKPNSSIIEISVQSEDRDETTKIANELARLYLNYRHGKHEDLVQNKLGSLRQQWDAQSEKVREAQANLQNKYFDILRARSTNQGEYYDPNAYASLQEARVKTESDYVQQRNQLANYKKMAPDDLREVLASSADDPSLVTIIQQLSRANSDLLHVRLDHPDDSPEVRDATATVAALNHKLTNSLADAMTKKQLEIAGLKSNLDALDLKLKNAKTNSNQPTIVDAEYQKAKDELDKIRLDRDELEKKLNDQESVQAILPTGLTAQLIDTAEIPAKPFLPDRKVAMTTMGAGGLLALIGLALLLISQRPKSVSRTE